MPQLGPIEFGVLRAGSRTGGPRDRTYLGYPVRENRWLQLQGTRPVLLNVRYAP
jgi:hypothetical protein